MTKARTKKASKKKAPKKRTRERVITELAKVVVPVDPLAEINALVSEFLASIEPRFMQHKLTFVARNLKREIDADIIITTEANADLGKLAAVVLDHANRAR